MKTAEELGKWFSETATQWALHKSQGTETGKHLRMGQFFMNELWTFDQELWKGVHGTDADCFQLDERVQDFYAKLHELASYGADD